MRIAITGASGLVGSALTEVLTLRGDDVIALSRDPESPDRWAVGDVAATAAAIEGADAVVNLAGAPVLGRRWTGKYKEELRRSRVEGTKTVVSAMEKAGVGVLVNASATGYYGHTGDAEVDEDHPPGSDFLADLCVDWEAAANAAREFDARVVTVRIGIVLSNDGGALPKMLGPIRMFVGGRIGNGRQGVPWIHIHDMASILAFALDNEKLAGPVNGVAPLAVTNATLTRALAKAVHRPAFLPVPRIALRILLGQAGGMLTTGQFAFPHRLLEAGFEYTYPDLETALEELLSENQS